jgi:hypothetical protein
MVWLVFSLVNDKITLNFRRPSKPSSNVRRLNRLSELLTVVCLDITQRVKTVLTIMDVNVYEPLALLTSSWSAGNHVAQHGHLIWQDRSPSSKSQVATTS